MPKKEPPTEPASGAPTPENAGAPRRAHAINTITLELNAATDLRSYDDGKWASVFAIHNLFRGKEHPPKGIPINVTFRGNTVAYALTAIRSGTHFTVTGTLDHDKGEQDKDFYRINADQLRVHTPKAGVTEDAA